MLIGVHKELAVLLVKVKGMNGRNARMSSPLAADVLRGSWRGWQVQREIAIMRLNGVQVGTSMKKFLGHVDE